MTASSLALSPRPTPIHYPDSDGQPMADNMTQFRLMVTAVGNLDSLLPDLVAGDLLWYPVEGDIRIRQAPDVMVAKGRPKGERSSYKQWEEGGQPPQVVFEIVSPGNTFAEMARKHRFYERYGVSEYYVYDPDHLTLSVYIREGERLEEVEFVGGWVSPLLGIRMKVGQDLELHGPDGERFLGFSEIKQRMDAAAQRAEAEAQRAEAEARRADALAAQLRALGIDPAV